MDSVLANANAPAVADLAYWEVIIAISLTLALMALMVVAMLTSPHRPRLDLALGVKHIVLMSWFGAFLFLTVRQGPSMDVLALRLILANALILATIWVAYEWAHERFGTANPVRIVRCRTRGECPPDGQR